MLVCKKDFVGRHKELEKEFASKKTELDAWYQDRELELNNQIERVRKREQDLDDRDNTHVRRELRQSLQAAVSSRANSFKLSKETRGLRWPVHLTVWGAALLMISLVYLSFQGLSAALAAKDVSATLVVFLTVRTMVGAVAAGALIWFYLRWLSQWFEKSSEAELALRQFELDVDRASWAVEAAIEWENQAGRPMPTELLNSITHGLFGAKGTQVDAEETAADQLASAILGSSARVKLHANGSEIEIEKPKRLQRKKIAS